MPRTWSRTDGINMCDVRCFFHFLISLDFINAVDVELQMLACSMFIIKFNKSCPLFVQRINSECMFCSVCNVCWIKVIAMNYICPYSQHWPSTHATNMPSMDGGRRHTGNRIDFTDESLALLIVIVIIISYPSTMLVRVCYFLTRHPISFQPLFWRRYQWLVSLLSLFSIIFFISRLFHSMFDWLSRESY